MLVKPLFKAFDLLQAPRVFEFVWHLLTGVSRLREDETDAAHEVLGPDAVRYAAVRVAEGRVLRLIFKRNGNRAFTLFRTINLPASGHHSRGNLDLLVHEMVHVYQFEQVGSVYIWQALRAQKTGGYSYGCWKQLAEDRQKGRRFNCYNREQQGQIAQDYYNNVMEAVPPGQRVAVNLRGLKKGEVKRGDTLASPGFLKPTRRIDAEVQLLDSQKHALKNGVAVRLLLGTTEVLAKVRLLDQKQLEPGATGLVQFRCRHDVSTHRTERFILRSYSPAQTSGGGRILDLEPPRHRRFDTAVTERLRSTAGGNTAEMVESTLAAAGAAGIETEVLREKLGLSEADIAAAVSAMDAVVVGGRRLVARSSHSQLVSEILAAVENYHEANARHQGVAAGSLRSGLGSAPHDAVFQHAIDDLVANGQLDDDNGILSSSGFDPLANLSDSERHVAGEIEGLFLDGGLAPPPVDTVLRMGAAHRSLYKLLIETGQIVPLRTYDRNSNMALHRDTLQQVEQRLQANYPYPKDFAVSEVRDLLGATRKYVIPLMEHLDATGVTIRTGNVRRLREH